MKPIDLSRLKNHVDFGYFNQNISRKSLKRSITDKLKAWELGKDYYDGDRNCGYGGFIDDGRWLKHLPKLLNLCAINLNTSNKISILDIGCKKGFIVDTAIKLGYSAIGIENHSYPLKKANKRIKQYLINQFLY